MDLDFQQKVSKMVCFNSFPEKTEVADVPAAVIHKPGITRWPSFIYDLYFRDYFLTSTTGINYILDYWKKRSKTSNSSTYFDIKPSVQHKFNEEIQEKLSTMVWSNGGCKSYYLKDNDGRNTSIWPGSTVSYRKRTKRMKLKEYDVTTPKY